MYIYIYIYIYVFSTSSIENKGHSIFVSLLSYVPKYTKWFVVFSGSQMFKMAGVPVFPGSQVISMPGFPVFTGSQVIEFSGFQYLQAPRS